MSDQSNPAPRDSRIDNRWFVRSALLVAGALILLSVFFEDIPGPRSWLTEWTNWGIKYISLVVAAHGVYKLADGLAWRLRNR